ncbi:MAG TPA: anti-sigma factor [Candidatus Baltobacteraceae bacterium]|jgi:anti-sigma factor RsiW|nr:anti-sigma factor [Candidatus Baltobacteraceae bacterium]
MNPHEAMLDDVAVYALGALPAAQARAVAQHIATCAECRQEYHRLQNAATAVGLSAEAEPSPLLKRRIMRQIRPNVAEMRAVRPIVWPAYAVAAAALAVALITGIFNISLSSELRQNQNTLVQMNAHNAQVTRQLAYQRAALADLVSPASQHYAVSTGQVVRHGARIYLAMDALPAPPKGKVYQAWTLRPGATLMTPSVTFVPDRNGVAVVPLPVNASRLAAVAVSLEPEGGSKQPTSTPTFVLKFS